MRRNEDYVRQLEETIGKFLAPLKDIPYPIAIKALSGFEVLEFASDDEQNKVLLPQLAEAANVAGQRAFREGIFARRPNEAGNRIEPFVIQALRDLGLQVDTPRTRSGKRKRVGYPDFEVQDQFGRTTYIDCKTYSARTKAQTFRTFYFSPSDDPKITKDAVHLLLSFELDTVERAGRSAYIPVSWQIYTLEKLLVQVKHEFNASNKALYRPGALLAEGDILTH